MDEECTVLVSRACSSSGGIHQNRLRHRNEEEDEEEDALSSGSSTTNTDDSSPLGWPLGRRQRCSSFASWDDGGKVTSSSSFTCEEKQAKREANTSDVELMKERFAKLLLGEDMSGGSKGVCAALAISNAMTNLAASVFGELWRLEPLSAERKTMWGREMEWLLSVSDYIVELVPSWQSFRDGSNMEIMVSRPRSDLQINLPALRKLDTMLLESLDSYKETEFWYVEQGIVLSEPAGTHGGGDSHSRKHAFQRQEEKWWLPTPRVPANGLSAAARKSLQNQRDCTNQILKAAMAINGQVLSEMAVPDLFWETLPKNGKSCLGETTYRGLTSESFSADFMLEHLDLSSEHSAIEAVNRVEAAIHIWRRKLQHHQQQQQLLLKDQGRNNGKSSWGKVKDHLVAEIDRSTLIERAESLLHSLKQRHPGLPQTALDMYKIQYNRDVGQSILEGYSRVLESLAFNILARIDDVMFIDDSTKEQQEQKFHKQLTPPSSARVPAGLVRRLVGLPPMHPHGHSRIANSTPYSSPSTSPNCSPESSPTTAVLECFQQLHCGTSTGSRDLKTIVEEASPPGFSSSVVQPASRKLATERSYARTLESSWKLVSPPGRD